MENIYLEIVKQKSDEELLAMVYQYRQWETAILIEAEAELQKRNILPDEIRLRKLALIERENILLSEGRESDWAGRVLGWLGIFGILGIIIGYHHSYGKVYSQYTGEEYFKYNESSRENGRYTLYIAMILHALFLLNKLMIFMQDRW